MPLPSQITLVRDDFFGTDRQQHRISAPPGANRRFYYVPHKELVAEDKRETLYAYPADYITKCPWLRREEYLYPVKKNGRLAKASRWISSERATELYNEYQVRQVMES